jgi:hypothetical protein
MPTFTVSYATEAERRAYERAIAFAGEVHALGLGAPDGSVLDACEALTLSKGRDFLRETLAGAAQARIDALEKKRGPTRPADTGRAGRGGGRDRS